MENKKLKAAVIGIGNMWGNHVRTYNEIDSIDLVAIADLNEVLGNEMSEKYWVKYYKSYEQMLEENEIDIVSIVVPTKFHFSVAKYCIDKGVHILLEKPITLDIKEGEELLSIAEKKGINMLVWHIERFNPAVQKVKQMIDAWELWDITAITARRIGGLPPQIRDANIVVDLSIHDIDIANYLTGKIPKEVTIHKKKNHLEEREDSAEIFMKYDTVSAYIQTNWVSPVKMRKLTVTGSDWYLEMDFISQKIEFYKSNYEKFKEKNSNYTDYIMKFADPDKIDISVWKKEPLKEEILFLTNAIISGNNIDSQFALDALKIALI